MVPPEPMRNTAIQIQTSPAVGLDVAENGTDVDEVLLSIFEVPLWGATAIYGVKYGVDATIVAATSVCPRQV